jgi:hypothetical protein
MEYEVETDGRTCGVFSCDAARTLTHDSKQNNPTELTQIEFNSPVFMFGFVFKGEG